MQKKLPTSPRLSAKELFAPCCQCMCPILLIFHLANLSHNAYCRRCSRRNSLYSGDPSSAFLWKVWVLGCLILQSMQSLMLHLPVFLVHPIQKIGFCNFKCNEKVVHCFLLLLYLFYLK